MLAIAVILFGIVIIAAAGAFMNDKIVEWTQERAERKADEDTWVDL